MRKITRKRSRRPIASRRGLLTAALLTAAALPASAAARPYTVVSCDAAAFAGYSAAAWTPFGNAGSAYAGCPSGGGATAGISNRLIGATYSGFAGSGHAFEAPPGATITHLRWGGRMARDGCEWGTYFRALPSTTAIVGLPQNRHCATNGFDNRQLPMTWTVPDGSTRVEQLVICGALQCPPGAALHSHHLAVTIDDPIPPSISLSGALASGQWVSGAATPGVNIAASDNAGIELVDASIGGRTLSRSYPCDRSQRTPCPTGTNAELFPTIAALPDGTHTLRGSALDAAGNSSHTLRDVLVDNTPPDPIVPQTIGGSGWRRANGFSVSWTNAPNRFAPEVRAHWKLCRTDGSCPWRGSHSEQNIHELSAFRVPIPGEFRLHIWLEDAAGNQREGNAAVPAELRFDPEPPELAFQPIDPADPLHVEVSAIDRHSGLAHGEIEMRALGASTWHGLAAERHGSSVTTTVDDERFRNGSYEFRARAVDHAGNEVSTGRRADGSAATLRLPARIETRLRVGVRRVTWRRVRRPGRKKATRKRVVRFDGSVIAKYGRRVRLHGSLTNADGQPIEKATVEALEDRPNGGLLPIGLTTTRADGRFTYVVRAKRNRTVLFRYLGSRRIASASRAFALRVPASSAIDVDRRRVRNGQQVLFTGRVVTPPLPRGGKLVEMQAYFRGRWRTFSTVRTDRRGRWRFPYRFGATVGTVHYRFRAKLPAEGGYPFVDGRSRVLTVVVNGP